MRCVQGYQSFSFKRCSPLRFPIHLKSSQSRKLNRLIPIIKNLNWRFGFPIIPVPTDFFHHRDIAFLSYHSFWRKTNKTLRNGVTFGTLTPLQIYTLLSLIGIVYYLAALHTTLHRQYWGWRITMYHLFFNHLLFINLAVVHISPNIANALTLYANFLTLFRTWIIKHSAINLLNHFKYIRTPRYLFIIELQAIVI